MARRRAGPTSGASDARLLVLTHGMSLALREREADAIDADDPASVQAAPGTTRAPADGPGGRYSTLRRRLFELRHNDRILRWRITALEIEAAGMRSRLDQFLVDRDRLEGEHRRAACAGRRPTSEAETPTPTNGWRRRIGSCSGGGVAAAPVATRRSGRSLPPPARGRSMSSVSMNCLKTPSLTRRSTSARCLPSAPASPLALALALEDHPGLVEDGVLDEDRHLRADGQGDRVARAGVDLDVATVVVDDQLGEERLVGQLVDDHLGQLAAERRDRPSRADRGSAGARPGRSASGWRWRRPRSGRSRSAGTAGAVFSLSMTTRL